MSLLNISRMSSIAVALLGQAVDAEAEREPAPLLGVEAAGAQHVRVHHPAAAELEPLTRRACWMSNSADGSVNGKYAGRSRDVEVGAEVRLGERLDRAGEVGEGDAAVDDEPLDLVEHRHVRGVGGVAAEHAAGHDHVDRRRLRLHHPDLHRRGVRAQHASCRARRVDVERVLHAARRVVGRHVERLEVVPVGLDLGPFGDLEAEADEHVLEPLPGLGDEVGVAASRARHAPR